MRTPTALGVLGAAALVACHATDQRTMTTPEQESADLPATAPGVGDGVVFAYFTSNGEDGMKLGVGPDPLHVHAARGGRAVMTSTLGAGLVRDPSMIHGPDGRWHVVFTTGWWAHGFGLSHSDDLVHWTEPDWAPVMESIPGTVNTWAPEIHWDPEREEYLVIWSSTVRGRFAETEWSSEPGPDGKGLNHRIWGATTKDFQSWSTPRVFFDPGFSAIDAVIVRDEPRRRWVMIFKDETFRPQPKKDLRLAFATSMQGPYTLSETRIAAAGAWVEGPTVIRSGEYWDILFDRYREGKFGAVRTSDWEKFEALAPPRLPAGAHHGCMVRVGGESSTGSR